MRLGGVYEIVFAHDTDAIPFRIAFGFAFSNGCLIFGRDGSVSLSPNRTTSQFADVQMKLFSCGTHAFIANYEV